MEGKQIGEPFRAVSPPAKAVRTENPVNRLRSFPICRLPLSAPLAGNALGHDLYRLQLAAAAFAHDRRPFRLLVLLGHRERQRERRRDGAEQGLQVVGKHHALDVLAGLLSSGEQQAAFP